MYGIEPMPLPPEEMEVPRNIEAEQTILGAILLDPEVFDIVDERLKGDEFYSKGHALIFEAMREISDEDNPIDMMFLTTKLQEKKILAEIGGISYLSDLANSVATTRTVPAYLKVVKEKHVHRQALITLRNQLHKAQSSENVEEILAEMQESTAKLTDEVPKAKTFQNVSEIAFEVFDNIEKRYQNKGQITGVPSGFVELDQMTTGLQRNDLIIVAARPSVGKTAFALNIAQNVGIRAKETVAIFSLEMSGAQLVQRMLCAEGDVDAGRVRTGYLDADDWSKLTMAIGKFREANILIDDSASLTVNEIRAKCRRLKKEHDLGLIIIDYLQLISGRGKENRQQEISEISRTLKQIARELEVPIIALSQLSRSVEQRQDKRPMLSDLRESGAIEQDADIVAFLYRDDYYDKESEKKNIIEIIVAKQRNGPVGTVELAFLKNYNKFANLDMRHEQTQRNEPDPRRQWA